MGASEQLAFKSNRDEIRFEVRYIYCNTAMSTICLQKQCILKIMNFNIMSYEIIIFVSFIILLLIIYVFIFERFGQY